MFLVQRKHSQFSYQAIYQDLLLKYTTLLIVAFHEDLFSIFYVGTCLYFPPEWLTKKSYFAVPSTVWSVGIVLYHMLQGSRPFLSDEDIVAAAVTFEIPISNGGIELTLVVNSFP